MTHINEYDPREAGDDAREARRQDIHDAREAWMCREVHARLSRLCQTRDGAQDVQAFGAESATWSMDITTRMQEAMTAYHRWLTADDPPDAGLAADMRAAACELVACWYQAAEYLAERQVPAGLGDGFDLGGES